MFNETVYNNTLTNLNNGVPVDAEQEATLASISLRDIQEVPPALVESGALRARRDTQKNYEQFEADREAGDLFRYDTTIKYNPELREKRQRDLTHGLAKMGSAEQGVIDLFTLTNAVAQEDENKPMLEVGEANALAKDLGVDIKFDRPTTEAEVRWVVAKKQQEEKMARELAYLSEGTNHGVMQDLMLTCSAISGAVGFYELAATAGLSLLGGAGVAGALGKFAGTGNNITKAICLAQQAELAQKRAKVVGNVLNDAWYVTRARNKGFAASLAYDTYRFGKGIQGTHASLATTMIPFAVDGVMSDLPRIAALSIDSDITHSGRYTGQDVVCELMMAGVIPGSLPAVGAGWRTLKSARTKIAEGAVKKIEQDAAAKVMEATEVGHAGEAELAQEVAEGAKQEVKTLFEDLDAAATPTEAGQQYADNIAELSGANFTEAEHTFLMEEGKRRLALGLPLKPLFDQMPHKTPWFSTVPDMMNMLKEAVANKFTGHDFYNLLIEKGYIKKEASLENDVFVNEGLAKRIDIENQIKKIKQELEENTEFLPEENHYEPKDWEKYEADKNKLSQLQEQLDNLPEFSESIEVKRKNIEESIINTEQRIKENTEFLPEENHYEPKDWEKYEADNTRLIRLKKQLKELSEQVVDQKQNTIFNTQALGDIFIDILSFVEGGSKYRIKLQGTGALEQRPIVGLTQNMMENLHFNIYKSKLLGDTEEGLDAALQVEDYLNNLSGIKAQIQEIIDTTKELAKGGIPYREQNVYKLSNGELGFLKDALNDLADNFVPFEIKKVISDLKSIVDEEQVHIAEVGHPREEMLPLIEQYNQTQKIYQEYQDIFVDLLGETRAGQGRHKDTLYFNLRRKRNSDLAQLEEMNKNIDEMINNADELYNSDLVFDKKYGDAEKVKQMIEDGQNIPELEYGYNHSSRTSAETKEYLRGDEALERRNLTLQAEIDSYKDKENSLLNKVYLKAKDLAAKIDKMRAKKDVNNTSLLTRLEKNIEGLNNIIASNYEEEKSALHTALRASSKLRSFIEMGVSSETAKTKFPKIYNGAKVELAKILESTIYTERYASTAPNALTFEAKRIKEAVDQATEEFLENISKDDAWKAALKPQADTVSDTAEEAAQKIAGIDAQQKMLGSLADPVIQNLKAEAQKLQAAQFLKVRALLNGVERCFDTTLGRVDENIIALASGTYVNAKQGSVSVSALARDINNEFYRFKNLCKQESKSTGTSVEEYMLNPNNWDEIQEALLDVDWFEAGLMSEEEKAVYAHNRANTIAGRAARAYHKILSDLAQDIYDLGASKYNTFNPFDNSKIRNLAAYLKKDCFSGEFFNNLPDDIKARFSGHHNKGEANAALAFMEWLDLDKHFLESRDKISYNAMRDAIVEGRYAEFAAEYKPEQLEKVWNKLYDKILSDDKTGFVPGLATGSKNIEEEFSNASAHYINGLEPRFHFKSNGSYKEAVKYMGYDNLRQMFENNVSSAKKAHAVLTLFGTDPGEFAEEMVQMGKLYADTVVRKKHGNDAAQLMIERLGSRTFDNNLKTLVTATCGNFTSPVTSFVKWASSILQLLGSSLIMKSAAKGLSDFTNIYQYLISAGLAQNTNIGEVWSGLAVYLKNSKTSELIDDLLLSQPFMTNAIYEATTGAPSIVAGGDSVADVIAGFTGRKFGKYAKAEDRMAAGVKSLTDGVLKMGCVTTAAEKNRGVAALNLMRTIGREARNKSFKQMDKRFQNMLGRYGIDEAEWDEIFRKHGVHNVDDYLSGIKGEKVELLGDEDFFLPNKIVDLDDETVRSFMKKHPDKFPVIDDMTVRRYKKSLTNKASILINDAADEMCCIPNARIRSMLLANNDPNTRTGLTWRTVTQFQSFGAGLCWYHWGRRMMSFIDQTDNLFTKNAFIQYGRETGGWGYAAPQALSFGGMVASMAFTTFMINELLATVTGTRQAFHDREGKIQFGSIGKKTMRALIDQTGLVGVGLDAAMGVFDFGRGSGGGIALSVAPVPSSLLSGAAKVAQAGMRSGNEGRRLQAMGAQTVSNLMQTTGIPRLPLTQAVYTMAIGDWLDQMSMGEDAYNRRYLRKYKENYMNPMDLKDNIQSVFTN